MLNDEFFYERLASGNVKSHNKAEQYLVEKYQEMLDPVDIKQKQIWLDRFYSRMSTSLYNGLFYRHQLLLMGDR